MAFGGCSTENPGPALSISPSGMTGTVQITGPTKFSAELVNTEADVTWTVSGGGTVSSTAGLHVIYIPPLGTVTGTLTATAGDLTASVQIASSPQVINIPNLTAPVTVQYDAQDIPHIRCAATIDCIAVQGYIQARDRFFPMDFLRHVARSKLSELIGADGLEQDVQLRTLFTTRAGHRIEDDLAAAQDPATKALLTAFAGGVNAYLAELRFLPNARLPGEYTQLPFPLTPEDIEDWTIEDTLALSRLQQFQLSESLSAESASGQFALVYAPRPPGDDSAPLADQGKMDAWIRAAAPPTEQAHTLDEKTPLQQPGALATGRLPGVDLSPWKGVLDATAARASSLRAFLLPTDGSFGSNNWVVSADKSATGFAMVANDPHLALQFPPLFHLSVLTSTNPSDNLDLAGGAFPGIPGALVGRGAHVSWGVTVVGYDVTDLYVEQFLPQANCPGGASGPPCVLFNDAPVSTLPVPQTFRVRVGPGSSGLRDVPDVVLIVPHHGPIIQAPDDNRKAVSVRWTGHEGNTQDVRAFLGLGTAIDVDDAIMALKDFAIGAQNFVLADDKGNIAYDPHALVPVRKFADTRVVVDPEKPIPPWFPLPGDGTAEWGDGTSDCAAATLTPVPASCWIADAELPQGKNPAKGYFFTANADPTSPSVSDDNDPLKHPPYLSFSWSDSSGFRATQIEQMIEARLAGGGKLSLADMEAIQSDHVSRPGMVFTALIAQLPPPTAGSPPELAIAKGVLDQWAANGWDCPTGLQGIDPRSSTVDPTLKVVQNSAGCFLFHAFLRTLFTNVFTDDLKVAGQGVNGLAAMKAMIFMLGLELDPATPAGGAGSTFCNDVGAKGELVASHTCAEQVEAALVQAVDVLSTAVGPTPGDWVWGRVHTIRPVSLLPLVTTNFEPGPYARPGGAFTVDVGNPSLAGGGLDFAYTSGGNVRHISVMDPAKPVVRMQLPGPERDGPTVFAGPDLLGEWVTNTYFDFAFGNQIDGVAVSNQIFQAP
jgi:penicillin amidase